MLLFIVHKMRKGMGAQYDYGVGKIENLIGVVGAGFVVLSVGYIMYTAIGRFFSPVALDSSPLAMAAVIMFVYAIVNGYFWMRNYRIHKQISSPITDIQWRVAMSNTVVACGILVSILAMILLRQYTWSLHIDPVISLTTAVCAL